MKRFIDGVRGRVVPIYAANGNDWEGHIVTMECVTGGVPLSLQKQASSAIEVVPVAGIAHEDQVGEPNEN